MAWKVAEQQLQGCVQLTQEAGGQLTLPGQFKFRSPLLPCKGYHLPTKLSRTLLSPHRSSNGGQGLGDQSSEQPAHWLYEHEQIISLL